MTDARKIIADAQSQANLASARATLDAIDDQLKIAADLRYKVYMAHITAGFEPDDAFVIMLNSTAAGDVL